MDVSSDYHWPPNREASKSEEFDIAIEADGFFVCGGDCMEQCALFVDGGYFAKVTEQNFDRPPIDFQRLSDVLSGPAQRLRTYFYDCVPYQGNPPTAHERAKHAAKANSLHAVQRSV